MNERSRRRRVERHCAAGIRAISGKPDAEYRRENLYLAGRRIPLYAPHLAASAVEDSLSRNRGVSDALALRLSLSDAALYRERMPEDGVARLVYDTLEQLRVESLAPPELKGMQANLDRAFADWCRDVRGGALAENESALIVYTLIQVVRSRLLNRPLDEQDDCLTEAARFQLAQIIGEELAALKAAATDQVRFAGLARKIATTVAGLTGSASGQLQGRSAVPISRLLLIPPDFEEPEGDVEGGAFSSPGDGAESGSGDAYHVYSRSHDREVGGESLYRREQRVKLRQELDALVAAQAVSIPRLALRLQRLFAGRQRAGWDFGEDEGYIDGRRLGQLVANPAYHRIFRKEKESPWCDTVVSFLIDNSGSMKQQRFETVTVLVDIFSRALSLAGISSEILGFTTGGWTGGRVMADWRADGMPANPGRLNERLHIVYKDADTPWRRARHSISAMLNPTHYREGLDGEALEWAAGRLRNRIESRKCLVMISDGAPMDSATSGHNEEYFLESHLRNVSHAIENNVEIELKAIGIALELDEFFRESVSLDLTGTLGGEAFHVLERLFTVSR